ncbi:unannotated protein [freshwater metagenome]|uniref:Unannotated protein n=1 Tax=freshwater metagenome TaxID=449393 RepID=A0A6J7DHL7_9ZZZZ|nr:isochorismatase family protein [Actinomycetota bacterium]
MTISRLDQERAALVVVDVQEAFRKAIGDFDTIAARCAILVQGAQALGVPVIVAEQYPAGLGETAPEIAVHLEGVACLEKTVFSVARADGFDLAGRDQVLLCGIETHVCVHQTAQDLLSDGIEIHLIRDALGSRAAVHHQAGIARMEQAGAAASSTEMALLELLGGAGSTPFKIIQGLIK